jgi:DNA-binding LacI/PurR family transcriptional regulator
MPHVSLIYQQPDIDSVIADDYPGMMQVMEHLLSLGHRRIGFLTLEVQPHAMSRRRLQAYHDALQSNGIKPEGSWVRCLHEPLKSGRSWEEMGYGDMRQWLDEDWNKLGCTALLAHNDETAVGVISALHDAGHRVPEDISVVGFDGTEIAHFHRPQLTTVEVPLAEIGARGHGLLTQQINRPLNDIVEQRPPALLTLPTQFRPGQSTGPCKQ